MGFWGEACLHEAGIPPLHERRLAATAGEGKRWVEVAWFDRFCGWLMAQHFVAWFSRMANSTPAVAPAHLQSHPPEQARDQAHELAVIFLGSLTFSVGKGVGRLRGHDTGEIV